jgi:hypothetical protein
VQNHSTDPVIWAQVHAHPRALRSEDLLREAEAQRALAELFPHLKLDALRAIQNLFPLQAQVRALRTLAHPLAYPLAHTPARTH